MGKKTEILGQQADGEFLLEEEFPISKTVAPDHGDAPVYNESTGKYEPAPVAGGHARLHNIESPLDHNVEGTLLDRQTIQYNLDDEKWEFVDFPDANTTLFPGITMLGTMLNYPKSASFAAASDIQYVRVYLIKDEEYDSLIVFITSRVSSADIRLGIYSQTDPGDIDLEPNSKVAETSVRTILVADEGTFVEIALTSNYTVPASGYYWLAMIYDGTPNAVSFATSETFPANYLPRREESGSGNTLPATASGLTDPASAVIFVAAKKVVT